MTDTRQPERFSLAPDLDIARVMTGLWQIADMERSGEAIDADAGAAALADYARAGFDSFDMADHYGSAELVAGRLLAGIRDGVIEYSGERPVVCTTKWCPPPGPMPPETVTAGVARSAERLGVASVDLMQLHWWTFEHPAWLDALRGLALERESGRVRHLGVTNFDTDHLRIAAAESIPLLTNQVSFSLIDRRAAGAMTAFCMESGTRLLAYGTLLGGFLSDRWVGKPEPTDIADWSRMKYKRFIDRAGGWQKFQAVLEALAAIAARHGVSVSNVATRWALEQPAVAAIIVGARLGESEHRTDNLRIFDFALDDSDRARLAPALDALNPIPGDCGDEYRRPPFLTASGDLSHHLEQVPPAFPAQPDPGRPDRLHVSTGSVWEEACGFSRAVRIGDRVLVSGTTATHTDGSMVAPGDAAAQATYILDKICASLSAAGAGRDDVVRTRIYMRDCDKWEPVARAHGRFFGAASPANTLVEVSRLVGDYEVEIEAEAVIR